MRRLIIIPAYNEAAAITGVLREIDQVVGNAFDIAVINDCSSDHTAQMCRDFSRVILLDLPLNLGIGGAVQTGYRYAWREGYDVVVQLDGDGQHDPRFLRALAAPIESGNCDLVIGSRFLERKGFQSTGLRRIGIRFFRQLIYTLMGRLITDPTSGFRACSRRVAGVFAQDYPRDYPEPETNAKLLRLGFRVREIPVVMRERQGGQSSIRMIQPSYYMVKVTLAILIDCLREGNKEGGTG